MLIVTVLIIVCVILLISWGFNGDAKSKAEAEGARLCPHCGYDLRGGHDRCPECGKPVIDDDDESAMHLFDDLYPAAAIEPRTPRDGEKLVKACDTSSTVEAAFLTQLLEARGIAVSREGQPRPTDYPPVSLRLMVWSDDADAAQALVAEVRRRQAQRHGIAGEP